MVSRDPKLKETFPEPPLVAYKVPPNLRSKVVRAKVPPIPAARPIRVIHGMKRCGGAKCPTCPYIQPGKTFKASATSYKVELNAAVDYNTKNIIYAVSSGQMRPAVHGSDQKQSEREVWPTC